MPGVPVGRLLLLISVCFVPTFAQEASRPLELGKPVERELLGGQTHAYTFDLAADQIARVTAEQHGITFALSVFAPDGARLFDVDRPDGASGEEAAIIRARQSGAYRLEVRSLDTLATAGRYVIRLDGFLTDADYLTERLAGVGRVWGAVKFFHPYLAYKEIDWDGALVKAIPHVKAALTPDEYRAAINTLLQTLNDPMTTAELATIKTDGSVPAAAAPQEPTYFRVVDGYVVVSAIEGGAALASGSIAATAKQPQMLAEISKAKGIVIDCRYRGVPPGAVPSFYLNAYLENVLPSLVHGSIPLGTKQYRLHNGYVPQRAGASGSYTSAFVTQTPGSIIGHATDKKPLAVVIDEKTPNLLPLLSGLQATGAKIVQIGEGNSGTGAQLHQMMLPEGVRVKLRVAEFVHPGGGSTFQPDVQRTNEAGAGESAIVAAIATLNAPAAYNSMGSWKTFATIPQGQKDDPYAQMSFPTEEYRLLALFRFWNIINCFYPYKHLTGAPWGTVLTDFIPRFLKTTSALEYEMTVAEMVARLHDSHGFVRGLQTLDQHLGMFAPPIRLAAAGGELVVTELIDPATEAAGITLGDVILAVDGEPVAQRLAALTRLRSLSTPRSAYGYIYPMVLRGAKDSTVTLRVRGTGGQIREMALTRTVSTGSVAGMRPRKTPIYQVLRNGYGYIDLARLPLVDARKAMDAVQNAPALIFDMRGYPHSTAWAIAPRLSDKEHITGALFRRPLQAAISLDDQDFGSGSPDYAFEQEIPRNNGTVYRGKVVMLINEFAISQSEHTCLFFEAATNVTFIGSPTNGANGDITNLVLPGGIYVTFTGQEVRHADGRQLQRVGIQPHVKVEPTAKGIREGRDEVLEAAVKYLDGTVKP